MSGHAQLDHVYRTDMVCYSILAVWKDFFDGYCRPVENGSVTGPLFGVAKYTIQIINKMQREHIKSWVPRQDITDRFNEHAQEWIKHTVWKSDCRSWYKNNETGRVNGRSNYSRAPHVAY
jgi:hypothetical protein